MTNCRTLKDCCLKTRQWKPKTEPRGEFCYIDVSSVSNDTYSITTPQAVTGQTAPGRARKIVRSRDVIYATIRPTLKRIALVPPEYDDHIASTAFCVVRADRTKAIPEYLYFLLLSDAVSKSIADAQHGASYPAVRDKDIFKQEVSLPPLPEQKKIAAILLKLQQAISAQDKIIQSLRDLKKSTMQHLFTHGLRGEKTKVTDIGEIPESWDVVPLADIASIERGKFTHRPRNDPAYYGGDIPFVQTGDVTRSNGRVRQYSQTLNELGLSVSKVFPAGTILITIAANIGDTGILEFDSAFPDSIIGITPEAAISHEYLEFYLRTQKTRMHMLAPKGTQMNINIEFLKPWPVKVAPLSEQREIASIITGVAGKLDNHESEKTVLQDLFKTTLNKLMTGDIRVADLNVNINEVEV